MLCSGLLVLHFSTSIYAQENAISFYPWLDKKALICHKSSHCAPLESHRRRSVLWLKMWMSQFIRMLLWRDGWSQMDVTLAGPMKPHTCTPWNILATVSGLSLGCIYICLCVFVTKVVSNRQCYFNNTITTFLHIFFILNSRDLNYIDFKKVCIQSIHFLSYSSFQKV